MSNFNFFLSAFLYFSNFLHWTWINTVALFTSGPLRRGQYRTAFAWKVRNLNLCPWTPSPAPPAEWASRCQIRALTFSHPGREACCEKERLLGHGTLIWFQFLSLPCSVILTISRATLVFRNAGMINLSYEVPLSVDRRAYAKHRMLYLGQVSIPKPSEPFFLPSPWSLKSLLLSSTACIFLISPVCIRRRDCDRSFMCSGNICPESQPRCTCTDAAGPIHAPTHGRISGFEFPMMLSKAQGRSVLSGLLYGWQEQNVPKLYVRHDKLPGSDRQSWAHPSLHSPPWACMLEGTGQLPKTWRAISFQCYESHNTSTLHRA